MRRNIFLILTSLTFALTVISCGTKQDVINTGVFDRNQHIDKTMLEMMKEDPRNWEWTVKAIEYAGLEAIFNGTDSNYPEITFLAIKSFTLERLIYTTKPDGINHCNSLEDYDKYMKDFNGVDNAIKQLIMQHIVKEVYMKEELTFRDQSKTLQDPEQTGFTLLLTEGGDEKHVLRACQEKTPHAGVPDLGPVKMLVYSLTKGDYIPVVTPDLKVKNGVIHALNDNYVVNLVF